MLGKNKCRILKEIRQKIADENDIPYVTRECTYQGECKGTCPRCEQELRYLEQQLAQRQRLGKTVTVTALCASLALTTSGCSPVLMSIAERILPGTSVSDPLAGKVEPVIEGEVEILDGEVAYEPDDIEIVEVPYEDDLSGAVAYEEEAQDFDG